MYSEQTEPAARKKKGLQEKQIRPAVQPQVNFVTSTNLIQQASIATLIFSLKLQEVPEIYTLVLELEK